MNSFPNLIPIERPPYIISEGKLNPYWISGFTTGDKKPGQDRLLINTTIELPSLKYLKG